MKKKNFQKTNPLLHVLEVIQLSDEILVLSNYKGKDLIIQSSTLFNMTFKTVIDLVKNEQIYYTKLVEVEKELPRKNKKLVDNNIKSSSKIKLQDIYG